MTTYSLLHADLLIEGRDSAAVVVGGYKASGEGRELGRQAIGSFTQTKTIQLQVGARTTRWVPGALA